MVVFTLHQRHINVIKYNDHTYVPDITKHKCKEFVNEFVKKKTV